MVSDIGADAVGLNFYPRSRRFVSLEAAVQIARRLAPGVRKVGVFVNASAEQILDAVGCVPLDAVQLHGDEPPEMLAQLGTIPVIRAFRLSQSGLGAAAEYLERCRQLGAVPAMVLVDAYHPGAYGGTGQRADWPAAAAYPLAPWHPPLVLAGGLDPDNVAEAIRAVRPRAVDTASGVEGPAGRKDRRRVELFVRRARQALAELQGDGER